ncbi:MAG: hypothetical protein IJV83_03695 [Clostridia bacterium]|nr:hypothetical protein [Clostridia bacterium]
MAQQKKGLIARLLEGKEKSEEYARSTLPTNRWQLFWDVFKGNFGKVVKANLLILLFFIPMIIVIYFGITFLKNSGVLGPYNQGTAMGFPCPGELTGLASWSTVQNEFMLYVAVLLSSVLAAVGLAGGMYVIRNMVWTEGIFVTNDFWRGVKLNYKNALQAALFFCTVLLIGKSMINFAEFTLDASDSGKVQEVFLKISIGTSWVFIVLAAMMSFWYIALGVNYKMKFLILLRNSFLITIGALPQTVFFGALALLPFALLLLYSVWPIGFILLIAIVVIFLFGFSWALLLWLDFAQWLFDKYINPKISGAKVGRGIYKKDGTAAEEGDSAAALEYQRTLLSHGRSRLVARPIKPIDDSLQVYELPQSFSREDLRRLRESKENIRDDTEAYAEEHKNDLRYVEYNRAFEEGERAVAEADAKKNKKRPKKPPKKLPENHEEPTED